MCNSWGGSVCPDRLRFPSEDCKLSGFFEYTEFDLPCFRKTLNICLTYATQGLYLAYDQHMLRGDRMKTVSIFKNGKNQAVRLPKEMEFQGINELAITKDGDVITLRPVRPDWLSFAEIEKADNDFIIEREDVLIDEGRFNFE